jgi:hypothetical protein
MRMTLKANDATTPVGNNLVFLIDVSGSMNSSDKLPLLKESFSYLTSQLTAEDRISIVTYSGSERVVLEGCPGNDTQTILNALNTLSAYGSTNGEAGLTRAYEIAQANFIEGGNNRIIMASDGDLNVGISSADQLKSYVAEKRDAGIYLSVLGFGTGNYRDANMEALADNGNGVYYYIDGMSEAEKVFGSDLLSTLYTVAEDVKATAIITVTISGFTARSLSSFKPGCPIVACSISARTACQMNLLFDVQPLIIPQEDKADMLFDSAISAAKKAGYVKKGDNVVLTAGVPLGVAGNTNMIRVTEVE